MKKLSSVFLCGDRSPYGMAHLAPITEYFDVKAIIVADSYRWDYFRKCLSGGETYCYTSKFKKIYVAIKDFAKKPFVFYREQKHNRRLNSFGIPLVKLNDVNSREAFSLIKGLSPDVLISAAYPQIFSQELINIAPRGAVNFHPSLLPKCRGAHPHYWCLATGEKQGGVTAHFMTSRIDDGDIIAQRAFDLDGIYYDELYKKIIKITPALVNDVALFLNNPDARPIRQDESIATVFRNDREIHRRLDFSRMSSLELFNRIRAGRSYVFFRGVRIYIERADIVSHNRHMTNNLSVSEGMVVDISSEGVVVSTIDHAFLVLKRVKWGRKVKPFTAWVAKFDVKIGETIA